MAEFLGITILLLLVAPFAFLAFLAVIVFIIGPIYAALCVAASRK